MSLIGSVLQPIVRSVIDRPVNPGAGDSAPTDPALVWYTGPVIEDAVFVAGSSIGPYDFGVHFQGPVNQAPPELVGGFEVNNWPGAVIDANTGIVTGTWGAEGDYTNLSVSATGAINTASTNSFNLELTPSQFNDPDFYALSYSRTDFEMGGVLLGFGSMNTVTDKGYTLNSDGDYEFIPANMPRWEGAYFVENTVLQNDLFTHANWGVGGTTTVQKHATELAPDGSAAWSFLVSSSSLIYSLDNTAQGRTHVIWAKVPVGHGTRVTHLGQQNNIFPATTLTEEWQKVIIDHVQSTNFSTFYLIDNRDAGDTATEILIWSPMSLDVSVIEAENVPAIITETVPVIAGFASKDNLTLFDPIPMLNYQPAAKNELTFSSDLSNVIWVTQGAPDATLNQIGLDGQPNTASIITDDKSTSYEAVEQEIPITAGTQRIVSKIWIKKDEDVSRYPGLLNMRGTNNVEILMLNTMTGALTASGGGAPTITYAESILENGWWKVLLAIDNNSSATFKLKIWAALSKDGVSFDNSTMGSAIVGNMEIHDNKTEDEIRELAPIISSTSVVTNIRSAYTFDWSNHSDDLIAYYLELIPHGDSNIMSTFLTVEAGKVNLKDGTNIANAPIVMDVRNKIGFFTAEGVMQINVDGVWSTEVAYDGQLLQLDADLFSGGLYTGSISEIANWNVADKAEAITTINNVMAR